MKPRSRLTMLPLICLALGAQAQDSEPVRPAALEISWTPMQMSDGDRAGPDTPGVQLSPGNAFGVLVRP